MHSDLKCPYTARNRLHVTGVNGDDTRETSVVVLFRQSVRLCRDVGIGNYLVNSRRVDARAYAMYAQIIPSFATWCRCDQVARFIRLNGSGIRALIRFRAITMAYLRLLSARMSATGIGPIMIRSVERRGVSTVYVEWWPACERFQMSRRVWECR